MIPDYDLAATKAAEVLCKYNISKTPVSPKMIFTESNICTLITFTEMSNMLGMERNSIISTFEVENHDAVTSVYVKNGKTKYIVAYNNRLSDSLVQRGLAREMGHIVLGHDGSKPENVRNIEAVCFARHLLCPRALIHTIQKKLGKMTVEMLGNMTGCYERCLMGMHRTPPTYVAPELNRQIKENFREYIDEFIEFQSYLSKEDDSMIANFGTFMDGYEE